MSKYLIIDGVEYKVHIAELKRRADILDKYAYRSEDGILHREVIGTYINYELKIGVEYDKELYNTLFDVLSAPVDYHTVSIPSDSVTFDGYFSSISDTILRIEDDGALYTGLSCKFTAMIPRRTPSSTTKYSITNTASFDSNETLNS